MPNFHFIGTCLLCFLLMSCDKKTPETSTETSSDEVVAMAAAVATSDEDAPVEIAQDYATQTMNAEADIDGLFGTTVISQNELNIFFESIFSPEGVDLYLSSWECFGLENSETIQFLGENLGMFSCTHIALEYMLKTDLEKEKTLRKENITHDMEEYESNIERGFMPSAYNDLLPVKLMWDRNKDEAFGYVNINAVRWLKQNIIPSPDMNISGVPAQDLYDRILKNFCRSMMFYYLYLHNELDTEKELRWYNRMMEDADSNAAGDWLKFRYNQREYPQPGIFTTEKQQPSYFIGFWLRRSIDGSDSELRSGLEKILRSYDRAWLEKITQQFQ